MIFKNNKSTAGSEEQYDPRLVGDILAEMLRSDSPLAVAYRKYKEEVERKENEEETGKDELFKDVFPNTELGVDLKLITRTPGRMAMGDMVDGAITHDGEYHYTFIQNAFEKKKVSVEQRNPHVYEGVRINVNRKDDGTLYPTFNRPRFTKDFTFQDFCREAADELRMVAGLVEEKQSGE